MLLYGEHEGCVMQCMLGCNCKRVGCVIYEYGVGVCMCVFKTCRGVFGLGELLMCNHIIEYRIECIESIADEFNDLLLLFLSVCDVLVWLCYILFCLNIPSAVFCFVLLVFCFVLFYFVFFCSVFSNIYIYIYIYKYIPVRHSFAYCFSLEA